MLQIIDTMVDLKEAGVDILTFGQYLQPTPLHLSVKEYVTPEKFEHWREYGENVVGFRCSKPRTCCMCSACQGTGGQHSLKTRSTGHATVMLRCQLPGR